jgi:hypothetical protein
MIRGIPKEGWKLRKHYHLPGLPFSQVMIRGIPKEGWKLAYRSLSASFIAISVGQKIPKWGCNTSTQYQNAPLFVFLACLLSYSFRLQID